MSEAHAPRSERIEARCLHDQIACAAERVVAPVVGVEQDDVERRLVRRALARAGGAAK